MTGVERVDVSELLNCLGSDEVREILLELYEAAREHRNSYRDFPETGTASRVEIDRAAARISAGWGRLDSALALMEPQP